jgi:hypothetical protein
MRSWVGFEPTSPFSLEMNFQEQQKLNYETGDKNE